MNESTQSPTLNVVLTGASGFLGRAIVGEFCEILQEKRTIDKTVKLFLPIRSKNGQSGEERCAKKFKDVTKNTENVLIQWLDPELGPSGWPKETHFVIFAAFDTSFYRGRKDMVHSSVRPIIEGLRHCTTLPSLQHVLVVSTAYVQPPLPFLRHENGVGVTDWSTTMEIFGTTDSINGNKKTPMQVYENLLVAGEEKEENTKDPKTLPAKKDHTHVNSYIFCKTLVEALMETSPEFASLRKTQRLSVLRPSIIGASIDGTQWDPKSPGCVAVSMAYKLPGSGSTCPWWTSLDLVPVCRVAQVALQVAFLSPCSATTKSNKMKQDEKVVIHYATNGIPYSIPVLAASCGQTCVLLPRRWIPMFQNMACTAADLFGYGDKVRCYDYFFSHTWDFPTVFGLDIPYYLRFSEHTSWLQREKERQENNKGGKMAFYPNVVASTVVLAAAFFLAMYCHKQAALENVVSMMNTLELEMFFQTFVTPWLVRFVPYSFASYGMVVLLSSLLHRWLAGSTPTDCVSSSSLEKALVPKSVLKVHNLFLALQSMILLVFSLHALWFSVRQTPNIQDFLLGNEKYSYPYCCTLLGSFLLSKLYEWVDTVMLILNGKPLKLLHLWHHATIFSGFYHGFWTGGIAWIAILNSTVHVIMYIYYSGVCKNWIRPFAKCITFLQILHLSGGFVLCVATMIWPLDPGPTLGETLSKILLPPHIYTSSFASSARGVLLLGSYVTLFLAYYGRRYCSTEKHGKGSLWVVLGGYRLQTTLKRQVQDRLFGAFRNISYSKKNLGIAWFSVASLVCWMEQYLIEQGVLAPLEKPVSTTANVTTATSNEKNGKMAAIHNGQNGH